MVSQNYIVRRIFSSYLDPEATGVNSTMLLGFPFLGHEESNLLSQTLSLFSSSSKRSTSAASWTLMLLLGIIKQGAGSLAENLNQSLSAVITLRLALQLQISYKSTVYKLKRSN